MEVIMSYYFSLVGIVIVLKVNRIVIVGKDIEKNGIFVRR